MKHPDIRERHFFEQKNSQSSYLAILLGFPPSHSSVIMNKIKYLSSSKFGWFAHEMLYNIITGRQIVSLLANASGQFGALNMSCISNPKDWVVIMLLEHRGIEFLLDSLETLAVDNNIVNAVSCIDVIVDFYIGHFQNEEQIMTEFKYRYMKEHLADHNKILNHLSEALAHFEKTGEIDIPCVSRKLLSSHHQHVDDFDRPLTDFLESGCYPPTDASPNERVPRF